VLPASAFPYYHNNEQKKNMNHWWYRKGREVQLVQLVESSDSEASGEDVAVSDKDERRLQRTMNKVLREVKDKGPQVHPALLTQIGSAKGRDWHGEEKSKYVRNAPHAHVARIVLICVRVRATSGRRRRWRSRCCGAIAGS
jgi:hypothetical protein